MYKRLLGSISSIISKKPCIVNSWLSALARLLPSMPYAIIGPSRTPGPAISAT